MGNSQSRGGNVLGGNDARRGYGAIAREDEEIVENMQGNNDQHEQNIHYWTLRGGAIVLTPRGVCACCLLSTLMFLSLLMLLFTLHFVAYNEYALIRNRFGTVYPSPVLTQGAHVLSPLSDTVYFPSTLQEVHFNSIVFSDSGVAFVMEIRYYYRLPKEHLFDIYDKFSNNYDSTVKRNSKKTIKNVAGEFSVSEFLGNRTQIEAALARKVSSDLYADTKVIADEQYFKIVNISFPDNIVQNSLKSAIALQMNEIQMNQQHVNVVVADTQQIVSKIKAEATQIIQNSIADSKAIIMTATFEYDNIVASARSEGIRHVIDILKMPEDYVTEFVHIMALLDNDVNKTIFKNMSSNIIVDV
jgi:regulator of protease activity HflC (stomatin/prohibitin superfamily)